MQPLMWALACWVIGFAASQARGGESRLEVIGSESIGGEKAELRVEIVEDSAADSDKQQRLPARVTITDAGGKHPDGSGRGTYADGRFFADGEFSLTVPAGETKVRILCGPHVVPVEQTVTAVAGKRTTLKATMHRWLDPQAMGWFCGDNHVHTQHDRKTAIRVGPEYTALQARANDLAFITEADNEISSETGRQFDTETFLYRVAPEIRPGPFVGHLNTPGIAHPLAHDRYQQLVKRPLPRQSLHAAVRELGGAMIHTHPFTPAYQLHWMGATEAWSDAVLGRCADLLDIDGPPAQMLWFAMLNLGNRVGASSYTDCALGRLDTPSPGDRRVYCKADSLDYRAIVEAMRGGRTVATNGGPLFVNATLAGRGIGETAPAAAREKLPLHIDCYSLLPLRNVAVYSGGQRIKVFDLRGRTGHVDIDDEIVPGDQPVNWYVVRAENERGDWAVASPIYVGGADGDESASAATDPAAPPASVLLLEISNHTRFIELRREFFAHLLVTVRPPDALAEVRLFRDGKVVQTFKPGDGDRWHDGRVPVTDIFGEYGPGWAWHKQADAVVHLQADWPVAESGWYSVEARTTAGRVLRTSEARYDQDAKASSAISVAELDGPGTSLSYRGYGEEMPRSEIKLPFEGDRWWYPERTYWRLQANFYGQEHKLDGIGNDQAPGYFRDAAQQ